MAMKVNIYFMRHGQKQDPKKLGISGDMVGLTGKGIEQVRESANRNLKGILFEQVFSSLKPRALQTATIAAEAAMTNSYGCAPFEVIPKEIFDFSSAPDLDKIPELSAKAKELANGGPIMVSHWLEAAPEMIGHLRDKITAGIIEVAKYFAEGEKDEYNILVGNHAPTCECACRDPKTMPVLSEADIVKYTVFAEEHATVIVASEYIPSGL